MGATNDNLLTVNSFAKKEVCTPAYIYKLIKEGDIKPVMIDGVRFIDKTIYHGVKKR